jgi:hypothetical protein
MSSYLSQSPVSFACSAVFIDTYYHLLTANDNSIGKVIKSALEA